MSTCIRAAAIRAVLGGSLALLGVPAWAQEGEDASRIRSSVFLAPERFTVGPGRELGVGLALGAVERARERIAWPETSWLFVRGGGRQWNMSATPAGAATDGLEEILLPVAEHGASLIGADFEPEVETWTGDELRAFFASRGGASFDPEIFVGSDEVRVRRQRSGAAIVRVRDDAMAGMPSPAAMTKAGLISEIRLDHDPTVLRAGDALRVRLYAGHRSRKGVAVLARGGEGPVQVVPVDGFGRCDIPVTSAGRWRLEFHYAELGSGEREPPEGGESIEGVDEDIGVTLYTATLVFEIGEGA